MKAHTMTPQEELCHDGVIGREEAAKLLDVSLRTLDQMLHDGDLPYTRSKKVRKIPRAAVTKYLADRLVGASG
jgi:excisionase family DNA binding protein